MPGKTLKVLWVSKHKLLREEQRQLHAYAERHGLELQLDTFPQKLPSIEWLVHRKVLPGGYDVVIAVLPLTMTAQLAELAQHHGFQLWRPRVGLLHYDRKLPCPDYDEDRDILSPAADADGKAVYVHKRFLHFEKVVAVEVVAEPVTTP